MKKILFVFFILFSFSTLPSMSWALPECVVNAKTWHNCFGTYIWDNGDKYVGEWKNNKKHGQGAYTFANGEKYVGEYKDGKTHGQGTYTFLSGSKYVGDHKDGKRHGQGTYTFASGAKYVGEYKDDKKHGQGTYTWGEGPNKGDKYIGEYRYGKKHGQGTYTWADGRREVGTWEHGKLNGYAITYNADGSVNQEGIFKDDVFQYAQKKSSTNSKSNSKLNKYKEFCEEIGFKLGTEKFANCVLKAMEKD